MLLGRRRRVPIALALAITVAGCGGGGDNSKRSASESPGAKVFADAGCGGCHTLGAAATNGTAGPNLDETKPDAARVERQVRNGGGGMPSFRDRLSDGEIAAVAKFVAEEAGGSGSVSMGAKFEPDDTTLDDCNGSDAVCLQQAFANLTYEDGPKPALAEFERRMKTNQAVEAGCHRIAHMMGAAALTRSDGSVGKAFAEGSAVCWSGFYHGILERAFRDVPEDKLGKVAGGLCSDTEVRRVTFVLYQCVHGLGHGLMIYTGYDLPLSLKTCDALGEAWDRQSCTGGVFMENLQSSYGAVSKWLKPNDPIYPCNAVAERYKYYCYLMVTSRILPLVSYNWDKAVPQCRLSERRWISLCYQSLGRDASGQTRQDPPQILAICAKAGSFERECVYGAARDITSNDAGGRRAAPFCLEAKPALRSKCFNGIGTILGGFKAQSAERKAECAAVTPPRYLRDCYAGAGA